MPITRKRPTANEKSVQNNNIFLKQERICLKKSQLAMSYEQFCEKQGTK